VANNREGWELSTEDFGADLGAEALHALLERAHELESQARVIRALVAAFEKVQNTDVAPGAARAEALIEVLSALAWIKDPREGT
jgi:hypothetical protein